MRYKIADRRFVIGTAASHWLTLVVQNGQDTFAVCHVQLDAVAELAREQREPFSVAFARVRAVARSASVRAVRSEDFAAAIS